jgi:hypothetical protein
VGGFKQVLIFNHMSNDNPNDQHWAMKSPKISKILLQEMVELKLRVNALQRAKEVRLIH